MEMYSSRECVQPPLPGVVTRGGRTFPYSNNSLQNSTTHHNISLEPHCGPTTKISSTIDHDQLLFPKKFKECLKQCLKDQSF